MGDIHGALPSGPIKGGDGRGEEAKGPYGEYQIQDVEHEILLRCPVRRRMGARTITARWEMRAGM
jgi:hypothetical protein